MSKTETAEPIKDFMDPTPVAPHEEGVSEGAIVSVVDQAEINQQITTARRYPRSVTGFRRRLYEMVTIDVDTASSCIYAIPRDGKMISGPSIRFAELLLVGWGNNRASSEVTNIDEEFIVAAGMFFDLESNSAVQAKVMRRITGKPSAQFPTGKRFSQDMIATTGNAAASIALRNAILRGIPKALWNDVFDEAKKVAAGNAQTFAFRRDKVMKELGIQGATPEMIFGLLGIKGMDDLSTDHIVHLRGLQNAIKDGETSLEDAFGSAKIAGEVSPRQPSRSDFDRNVTSETGEKKPEEKPKPEGGQEPKPAAEAPAVPKQAAAESKPQEVQPSASSAFEDWFKDQIEEMKTIDSFRALSEHSDFVMQELKDDPDREKEFMKAFEDRKAAILAAAKASRKSK